MAQDDHTEKRLMNGNRKITRNSTPLRRALIAAVLLVIATAPVPARAVTALSVSKANGYTVMERSGLTAAKSNGYALMSRGGMCTAKSNAYALITRGGMSTAKTNGYALITRQGLTTAKSSGYALISRQGLTTAKAVAYVLVKASQPVVTIMTRNDKTAAPAVSRAILASADLCSSKNAIPCSREGVMP
jgi:hypothetical protein